MSRGRLAVQFAAESDRWMATWTSMPQLTESANLPPAPDTQGDQVMVDTTLRQTVHVTIGGPASGGTLTTCSAGRSSRSRPCPWPGPAGCGR